MKRVGKPTKQFLKQKQKTTHTASAPSPDARRTFSAVDRPGSAEPMLAVGALGGCFRSRGRASNTRDRANIHKLYFFFYLSTDFYTHVQGNWFIFQSRARFSHKVSPMG
jgi:hypothetical protein